ncbi:hypothetical protein [Halorubrum halodurans]|uniref:hypothetical protein n=1 Tax=Halorubrum halodurans TaxID=1383851 RepID=UPI001179E0D6|nr:hypothetical protein [Halorubrum halodurans]
MTESPTPWQAVELVVDPRTPRPRHAPPLSTTLAEIVHTALWDHGCGPVAYLSLPGIVRHRTLLWAGSEPEHPLSIPNVDCSEITDATATLAQLAVNAGAGDLGISIVDVDPRPLGQTSAFTERLLAEDPTALTNSTRSPPLTPVLDAASSHPHALSVVADRGTDGTELAVRLVDFTPAAQICDRDELAAPPRGSMSDVIDSPDTLTNWELPEAHGWDRQIEDGLPTDQPLFRQTSASQYDDNAPNHALAIAGSSAEYAQVVTQSPADPLAHDYQSLGVTGRFTTTGTHLPAFYPVVTRLYPTSLWDQIESRAPARITTITPVVVPNGMHVADTDPTAQTSRVTTQDITPTGSAFEQGVVRWCLERGETITPVEHSSSAVSFHRTAVDGTHTLVYLAASEPLHPGRLLAAVWDAHHDPALSGISVFTASKAIGQQAVTILGRPFKPPTGPTTTLYRQPTMLADETGIAVRTAELPPETWEVTPSNELRCLVDGDCLASGRLRAPLETFTAQCPRVSAIDNGGARVTYPDGTTMTSIDRKAVEATVSPVYAPARPVHLAMGRETASVFVHNGSDFRGVRWPSKTSESTSTDRDELMAAIRL